MASRRTSRLIGDVIKRQNLLVLSADATVRQATQEMARSRVGSVIVAEDGRLAGIFTERDALCRVLAAGLDADRTPLSAVMTRHVTTISPERTLVHALHLMHDNGFRHVPVVQDGRPVGMVSIRDALGSELAHFEHELRAKEALLEIVA